LTKLREQLVPHTLSQADWDLEVSEARALVARTLIDVARRAAPDPKGIKRHVFSETRADGSLDLQQQGGLRCAGVEPAPGSERAEPQGPRINLVTAVRRTLEHELAVNPRMLIFGEDVGRKGGVHAATLGLQERFGVDRVFDTSLSEEGIIGRAVGMAAAGLMPVPEIQFRKYADPAAEQLNDCGTMRWRNCESILPRRWWCAFPVDSSSAAIPGTANRTKLQWLHGVGWRLAMPSNAQDAVGLLRSALRGNDPTIFFEHRSRSMAAGRAAPTPATNSSCRSQGQPVARGHGADRCHLGRDGGALRAGDRGQRQVGGTARLAHAVALDREATLASVTQDAPLPHCSRGQR